MMLVYDADVRASTSQALGHPYILALGSVYSAPTLTSATSTSDTGLSSPTQLRATNVGKDSGSVAPLFSLKPSHSNYQVPMNTAASVVPSVAAVLSSYNSNLDSHADPASMLKMGLIAKPAIDAITTEEQATEGSMHALKLTDAETVMSSADWADTNASMVVVTYSSSSEDTSGDCTGSSKRRSSQEETSNSMRSAILH